MVNSQLERAPFSRPSQQCHFPPETILVRGSPRNWFFVETLLPESTSLSTLVLRDRQMKGSASLVSDLKLILQTPTSETLSRKPRRRCDCLTLGCSALTLFASNSTDLPNRISTPWSTFLFRAGNSDQSVGSVEDATTVRKMVRSYMKRPRSIILAVVSAKSDFALQEVTEYARELDSKGTRTLGLITKPDTLDAGSDSEAAYLKLAQNKDVLF